MQYLNQGLALYLKLFFLLTPFFVLSTFISLTEGIEKGLHSRLAFRIALGAAGVTLVIYFAGSLIMRIFGITVDAFRAGSGVLLLLSAVSLVFGNSAKDKQSKLDQNQLMDMAVVPLAVPITAGPATLGALMVMGTTTSGIDMHLLTAVAIILACASIGIMLSLSNRILKLFGHSNITILSKITGLILSAIALQMIIVGVKNLWIMN